MEDTYAPFPHADDNKMDIMCVKGDLDPALHKQLPWYKHKFELYEHTVEKGDMLINNTDDNIVVCRGDATGHIFCAKPGKCIEPLDGKVVCSEPVLQFAK